MLSAGSGRSWLEMVFIGITAYSCALNVGVCAHELGDHMWAVSL